MFALEELGRLGTCVRGHLGGLSYDVDTKVRLCLLSIFDVECLSLLIQLLEGNHTILWYDPTFTSHIIARSRIHLGLARFPGQKKVVGTGRIENSFFFVYLIVFHYSCLFEK